MEHVSYFEGYFFISIIQSAWPFFIDGSFRYKNNDDDFLGGMITDILILNSPTYFCCQKCHYWHGMAPVIFSITIYLYYQWHFSGIIAVIIIATSSLTITNMHNFVSEISNYHHDYHHSSNVERASQFIKLLESTLTISYHCKL